MLHGIVKVPVTDLRAAPDFKSERLSQALLGTPVEIREVRKEYAKIALRDGYIGWSRIDHVTQVAFGLWRVYVAAPKAQVKTEMVVVSEDASESAEPLRVFFGTELVISSEKRYTVFSIPNGPKARISKEHLVFRDKRKNAGVTGKKLIATARRFLGVPYLWGGITPLGFDCSGLVQSVYRFHGLDVPRDSKDQRHVGYAVERDELQSGDLLFFPGHVAISCGGTDVLHASASRGMVALDSLDPGASNYRQDLDVEYEFARRLPL
jgi:cell wall-associated NlpC family hydrolase